MVATPAHPFRCTTAGILKSMESRLPQQLQRRNMMS